jgi:hypothetical protein
LVLFSVFFCGERAQRGVKSLTPVALHCPAAQGVSSRAVEDDMAKALEVISDARGTVVIGFVAADVLYLRAAGEISSGLGARCVAQVRALLSAKKSVSCFFDFSSALGSDLAARNAIMQALVARRHRLVSILALVRGGAMIARARAMIAILEGLVHLVEDASAFHEALLVAAPSAHKKLPPSRPIPAAGTDRCSAPSVRPRSLRPRTRSQTYA